MKPLEVRWYSPDLPDGGVDFLEVDDDPYDWVALIVEAYEEDGPEWWDRYGEASVKAAMVVSGDVPASMVEEFSKECFARAADIRRAAPEDSSQGR